MRTLTVVGRIAVAIVVLLAVAVGAWGGQVPLTLEEARAYVAAHPEDAALDVVALDTIELAVPTVRLPLTVLTVTDDVAVVTYAGPIVVDVAGGRLLYEVRLPEVRVRIAPRGFPWGTVVVAVVVAAAAGFVGGWAAGTP
jgi:hypothetical protein